VNTSGHILSSVYNCTKRLLICAPKLRLSLFTPRKLW